MVYDQRAEVFGTKGALAISTTLILMQYLVAKKVVAEKPYVFLLRTLYDGICHEVKIFC